MGLGSVQNVGPVYTEQRAIHNDIKLDTAVDTGDTVSMHSAHYLDTGQKWTEDNRQTVSGERRTMGRAGRSVDTHWTAVESRQRWTVDVGGQWTSVDGGPCADDGRWTVVVVVATHMSAARRLHRGGTSNSLQRARGKEIT